MTAENRAEVWTDTMRVIARRYDLNDAHGRVCFRAAFFDTAKNTTATGVRMAAEALGVEPGADRFATLRAICGAFIERETA